jgi:hypothetical protein
MVVEKLRMINFLHERSVRIKQNIDRLKSYRPIYEEKAASSECKCFTPLVVDETPEGTKLIEGIEALKARIDLIN